MTPLEIFAIYSASDAEATKALYARLSACEPFGNVAVNLLRAHKASARAKKYRGGNSRGSYRAQAYERKDWSIAELCRALLGITIGIAPEMRVIRWGWGRDPKAVGFENVLYVDLPTGQVSFHNGCRHDGPNYDGTWDGVRDAGADRICAWASAVLEGKGGELVKSTAPSEPDSTYRARLLVVVRSEDRQATAFASAFSLDMIGLRYGIERGRA